MTEFPMTIASVIGARPQFIKYFPIAGAIAAARKRVGALREILVHTGQHYDDSMSKVFFDELGIREPDYHLGAGSGNHGAQTALILKESEAVFLKERPDVVMVYGDTNSTIGAALAAAKLHIPVAHVEAGLRSFNKRMPEEINRVATDHLSTLLFCPSMTAIRNLAAEGMTHALHGGALIPEGFDDLGDVDMNRPAVVNVGDVMEDVLRHSVETAKARSRVLETLGLTPKSYLLLTVHRAESTDDPEQFAHIVRRVNEISAGKTVIFPMHPRTKKAYAAVREKLHDRVRIIEPVGHFDIVMLLANSSLVMTDSGGMQKEAYWLKTPCVTLRDRTEWVETVESGWNVLMKDYRGSHTIAEQATSRYGDGNAAGRIVDLTVKICRGKEKR